MKDKINNKVPLDDLVLREEPEVFTRWRDPTIKEYKKEISRLNNIIDELEKYLEEQSKLECYQTDFIGDCLYNDACKVVLDKLKKLKEGKNS